MDFFEKMSYCKESESGKDKIIFLSEEDAKKPSNVEFTKPAEEPVGMFTKEGDINWACPCLGSMPSGPCGVEFREAFECFHYRYVIKYVQANLFQKHLLLHQLTQNMTKIVH